MSPRITRTTYFCDVEGEVFRRQQEAPHARAEEQTELPLVDDQTQMDLKQGTLHDQLANQLGLG